jgi:hypothetical protein
MYTRRVIATLLILALSWSVNAQSLEDILLPGCSYGFQGNAPTNFDLCAWSHYMQFIIFIFFLILGIGLTGTIILVIFYILRKFGRCGNQFPTTSYTLTGKRVFSGIYTTLALLIVFSCFCGIVFSIMYIAGAGMLITTAFNVVTDTINTVQSGTTTLSGTASLITGFAASFSGMSDAVVTSWQTSNTALGYVSSLDAQYTNVSNDVSVQYLRDNLVTPFVSTSNQLLQLTTNSGFTFNSTNPLSIFPLDLNSRYPLSQILDTFTFGLHDQPTDPNVDALYGFNSEKLTAIKAIKERLQNTANNLQVAQSLTEGTIRNVVNVYVSFKNSLNNSAGASLQLSNLQNYLTSGNVESGYRALLAFFALFFLLGFLGVGIAYVIFAVCGILRNGRATKVGACCSISLVFWAFVYAAACLFVFMIFSPYCVYQTELFDPARLDANFQAQYPNFTSALNFTYGLMTCSGSETILDVMGRITSGPPLTEQSAAFFQAINASIAYTQNITNDVPYCLATYNGVVTNETATSLIGGQNQLILTFAALQALFSVPPSPVSTLTPHPTPAPTNVTTTAAPTTTTSAPTPAPTFNLTTLVALLAQVDDFGNYYENLNIYEYDALISQINSYTTVLNVTNTNGTTSILYIFYTRANVSLLDTTQAPYVYSTTQPYATNQTVVQILSGLQSQVNPSMSGMYQKIVYFQGNFTAYYNTLRTTIVNGTLFNVTLLNAVSNIQTSYSELGYYLNILNAQVSGIYPWQNPLESNAQGLFTFISNLATAKCSNIGDSMNQVNYDICSVMNTATVFIGLSSFFVGLFTFLLYPVALMAAKRFTGNTVDDDIDSLHSRADALASRATGRLRLRI